MKIDSLFSIFILGANQLIRSQRNKIKPRFFMQIWLYYQRSHVDQETELFVFDFTAIVAGVGGSLGLFLGFSCLQVANSLLDKLFFYFNDKCRKSSVASRAVTAVTK